ncbi:MAG TPA: PH domain-containing protein [Anaerolineales bacterium]
MNTGLFQPSKRNGLLFHGIILIVLAVLSAWGFINLSRTTIGENFVTYLLVGLIAFAPVPWIGYRAYSLLRAEYVLNRDGLELRWGLRDEAIPLNDIEWVRPGNELTHPLRLPSLSVPGAILGLRRHPDLGVVEFIASDRKNLLLVATAKRVFAISPANPLDFTQTFARAIELGSITPAQPKSLYPSFILAEAWENGLTRYLWLASIFLNLGLFVWVSLIIPAYPRIGLGFNPDGTVDAVPSLQLIILPLISTLLALTGFLTGLYYFRWEKTRAISFILWISSALESLSFLIAILFILSVPV